MDNSIEEKLLAFNRRFLWFKITRGSLLALGLIVIYLLLITGLEAAFRLSSLGRSILFFSFVGAVASSLVAYVLWPTLQYIALSKRERSRRAACLIGAFYPEVDDKLLNYIELRDGEHSDFELVKASLKQRSAFLSVFDFKRVLPWRESLKYWPVLAAPILLVVVLASFGALSGVQDAQRRIFSYTEEFKAPFPFEVELLSDPKAEVGSVYAMEVRFSGEAEPSEMYMFQEGQSIRLSPKGDGVFSYEFAPFLRSQTLAFAFGETRSESIEIMAYDSPRLEYFKMEVVPPAYTGLSSDLVELSAVSAVPEGSRLSLVVEAKHVAKLKLHSDEEVEELVKREGSFRYDKSLIRDWEFFLSGENAFSNKTLSGLKRIEIIPDNPPALEVNWDYDSLSNRLSFAFTAQDDYGLSRAKLLFKNAEGRELKNMDLAKLGLSPNRGRGFVALDEILPKSGNISVQLAVWDNDGVRGAKPTFSPEFRLYTLDKIDRKEQKQARLSQINQKEQQNAVDRQKLNEELRKALDKMKRERMDYKAERKLEDLLEKAEKLQEERKKLEAEEQKSEESLESPDPEKQRKEEELAKLLEEIEALKDKLGLEELQEKLEKLQQLSQEQLEADQRNEALEEQLRMERDLLQAVDEFQQQARKEEALSKEMDKAGEERQAEQEQLKREFDQAMQKVEEAMEKSQALQKAAEKNELSEKMEEAEKAMQKASDSQPSDKQQRQSQKKSSEQLRELAQSLQNSLLQMQSSSQAEDAAKLRRILENVELLSHGSEALLDRISGLSPDDPSLRDGLLELNRLRRGTRVIEDSLNALAKRNPQIKEVVFEELNRVETYSAKALASLQETEVLAGSGHLQYVMLGANNLALLLDASLQNMRQQMAAQKPGNQNCEKPGGSKPNKAGMAKKQGELAEQMQKMMEGRKPGQGQKQNGKGEGQDGQNGELARIISQQEQLRRAFQEEKSKGGSKSGDKALEQLMEDLERDLYDGKITKQTLDRAREIETRLLEDERAERTQDQDEERQSEEAKELRQEAVPELDYPDQRRPEQEGLRYEPLKLRGGYGQK